MTKNQPKKLIIFDMDGTLYTFREGSYSKSALRKTVEKNAVKFIVNKLNKDIVSAEKILEDIIADYGEHISVAFEKQYQISREEYFNTVWNIDPKNIVTFDPNVRLVLDGIIQKNLLPIVVSDAPRIWIKNVLEYLNVWNLLENNIYSGETDRRKAFMNVFEYVMKNLYFEPNDTIIVGDQEKTDILPAKQIGAISVFIEGKNPKSIRADYSIKSIAELTGVIRKIK